MRWTIGSAVLAITILCGAANAAEVKYFTLPSGAGPHDVAAAPDGTVWYTGQGAGHLGRLDPKRERSKSFRLASARRHMV